MKIVMYGALILIWTSSCSTPNTNETKSSDTTAVVNKAKVVADGSLVPPKEASFNFFSTVVRDANAKNGVKVTDVRRGKFTVLYGQKNIEVDIHMEDGDRTLMLNWTQKQQTNSPDNDGTVKKSLLFSGAAAYDNTHAEVEYFFGASNDVQSVTLRTTGGVAVLMNIPARESINSSYNRRVIGHWSVPHDADYILELNADGTFKYNTWIDEGQDFKMQEQITTGTYTFNGKKVTLKHTDGIQEVWSYSVYRDGFGHIIRPSGKGILDYLRSEDVQ